MSGPAYCGCCGSDAWGICTVCQYSIGDSEHCVCYCDKPTRLQLSEQEIAMRVESSVRQMQELTGRANTVTMGGDAWLDARGYGRKTPKVEP